MSPALHARFRESEAFRPEETLPEPWARHARRAELARPALELELEAARARERRAPDLVFPGVVCGASMTLFVATAVALQETWLTWRQASPVLALALAAYSAALVFAGR